MCMDETVQFKCYLLAHNILHTDKHAISFPKYPIKPVTLESVLIPYQTFVLKIILFKFFFSKHTVNSSGLVQHGSLTNGVGRPTDPSPGRWGREKNVKGREMGLKTKQWQQATRGN